MDGMQQPGGVDDTFADILARDGRYDPMVYVFTLAQFAKLFEGSEGRNVTSADFLEEFRASALDEFGPMAYAVMRSWGLENCTDIGEVVFNLVESGRLGESESDKRADFIGGFDFKTEFLDPFAA